MQYVPELGKIIEGDARRDAIHVAVAPLVLGATMYAGDHFSLNDKGEAVPDYPWIGIIDPYLPPDMPFNKGSRVWGCLYPNTVTSLRHVWQHPAFKAKLPEGK